MHKQIDMTPAEAHGTVQAFGVGGRLEAAGAWQLYNRCREMREKGHLQLVISLEGVSFIASSGVGTLLQIAEEFRAADGSIIYANPSEDVTRVVELLNLNEYLRIEDTVEDAVRAAAA
jgi:anti-anti-sigma factor